MKSVILSSVLSVFVTCIGCGCFVVKPLAEERDQYKMEYQVVLKERDEMTKLADSSTELAKQFMTQAETLDRQFNQLSKITQECVVNFNKLKSTLIN